MTKPRGCRRLGPAPRARQLLVYLYYVAAFVSLVLPPTCLAAYQLPWAPAGGFDAIRPPEPKGSRDSPFAGPMPRANPGKVSGIPLI